MSAHATMGSRYRITSSIRSLPYHNMSPTLFFRYRKLQVFDDRSWDRCAALSAASKLMARTQNRNWSDCRSATREPGVPAGPVDATTTLPLVFRSRRHLSISRCCNVDHVGKLEESLVIVLRTYLCLCVCQSVCLLLSKFYIRGASQ